jgi:hypothetical protein
MSFRDPFLRSARLLWPLARLVLPITGCLACSPVTVATASESADAAVFDAGIDVATGADSGGGAVPPDGGSCAPGDVVTYHPAYHPAAVQPQACAGSPGLVEQFYEACLGAGRSTDACNGFRQANADCAACIVTPESAKAYGPIIDHGAFVTANVSGCIDVEVERAGAGDAGEWASDALVCAKAIDALEGCELAACEANCPVSPGSAASLAQFQGCTSAADGAGCSTFAAAVTCTGPDAGVSAPATCLQGDFSAYYHDVVPLFCLPPPAVEAGAPLVDGGAGD